MQINHFILKRVVFIVEGNEDEGKVPISRQQRIDAPWVYVHIGTSSTNMSRCYSRDSFLYIADEQPQDKVNTPQKKITKVQSCYKKNRKKS